MDCTNSLLNVDGTVAAYRLPLLLAGNSVVLKQASKYFERGLQKCPRSVPLWLCAADCEIKQKRFTKA